jgi:hypothetical protein
MHTFPPKIFRLKIEKNQSFDSAIGQNGHFWKTDIFGKMVILRQIYTYHTYYRLLLCDKSNLSVSGLWVQKRTF